MRSYPEQAEHLYTSYGVLRRFLGFPDLFKLVLYHLKQSALSKSHF